MCTTYITVNQKRVCTIPEALPQTCWVKKENNGKRRVDEDDCSPLTSMPGTLLATMLDAEQHFLRTPMLHV